jgi:hypothetical protein
VPQDAVSAALGSRAPGDIGSDAEPTIALELGELAQLKLAAISRHVSQTGSAGAFHDWDPSARDGWLAREHYRLAASAVPVHATETGLFDGLP